MQFFSSLLIVFHLLYIGFLDLYLVSSQRTIDTFQCRVVKYEMMDRFLAPRICRIFRVEHFQSTHFQRDCVFMFFFKVNQFCLQPTGLKNTHDVWTLKIFTHLFLEKVLFYTSAEFTLHIGWLSSNQHTLGGTQSVEIQPISFITFHHVGGILYETSIIQNGHDFKLIHSEHHYWNRYRNWLWFEFF